MEHQYWVIVASEEHVKQGVEGGFCMANHGKEAPLRKMHKGDGIVYYSPKDKMSSLTPLQAFTAIGTIADDTVYQHKMTTDFVPFRRNVAYKPALKPLPIKPLIEELDFIENKKSWGYKFRFGFFEVSKKDYQLIEHKMMG